MRGRFFYFLSFPPPSDPTQAFKTIYPPAQLAFVGLRQHKICLRSFFGIFGLRRRHFWSPPATFLGAAGDIFGVRQRHFWAPPATLLGSAGDIFGLRQLHFWAPPATFLGSVGDICGLRRRHFWAPPATFLGSPGDIF